MATPSNRRFRLATAPVLFTLALVAAACSASPAGAAPASQAPAGDGSGSSAPNAQGPSGDAPGQIDPCVVLTKADVQPFFSIPVITELPGPKEIGDTCEFAGNDGALGLATSLDINVRTGQDATDSWTQATAPGGNDEMFSGVGDQAEHYPGSADFVSIKGDVACGLTTVG